MTDYELEKAISELEKADETITKKIIKCGEEASIARNNLLWDGVVSVKEYLAPGNKYKIMWTLKETTEKSGDGGYKLGAESEDLKNRKNVKEEWKRLLTLDENGMPYNKTLYGAICITYSLLNNYNERYEPENDPEMSREIFKRVAWVNVSKECKGNKSTNKKELQTFYERWKKILFKQIETYSPDILIFGGTFYLFKEDWKKKFGDWPKGNEPSLGKYSFQGDMLVVPTKHPSYPFKKDANMKIEEYVNQVTRKIKQKMEERNK